MATAVRHISIPAVSLLAGLLVQLPVIAQPQPRQKIEVSKLGPQAGERVPDFNLRTRLARRRPAVDHGTQGCDARFCPFGRLVPVLQDPARGPSVRC